jgi:hypothetical protein
MSDQSNIITQRQKPVDFLGRMAVLVTIWFGTTYIVRSIEFVIKVGAGTVKACLVLNYRDKRHI